MPTNRPRFDTTRWSLVLAAGDRQQPQAAAALADLCAAYWYPLYAFVRRDGMAENDAMDLVQGFVADLLERGELAAAPERGRFRSYLIGALQNFRRNARRAAKTKKRGGDQVVLSLDDAEARYTREPACTESPAALFDRRWAVLLLDRALDRLEAEYIGRGRGPAFGALRDTLSGASAGTYADKAAVLGISVSAVKVGVHRLRARMRELLRDEVAQTLASPDDVEAELQHLFAALAG